MAARTGTLVVVSFPVPRLLSLLAVLALVGAACSSDSDSGTETSAAPSADAESADTEGGDDAAAADDGGAEAPADDAVESGSDTADAGSASWPHTFVADEIGGGQIDATDLAGQDVILWFWAPW